MAGAPNSLVVPRSCSVEGCDRLLRARDGRWCSMHYGRWRRNGDPLATTRNSPCVWISWDENGRPSCEHGPAYARGNRWCCGAKSRASYKRHLDYYAQYRQTHREQQRKYVAQHYKANREKYLRKMRQWELDNPDRAREIGREYQRRRLGWYDEGGMATEPLNVRRIG